MFPSSTDSDNNRPTYPLYANQNKQLGTGDGQSDSYQELKGPAELDPFIVELLGKPTERLFLLKIEQELQQFIHNNRLYRLDLPPMNSYQRLMVHKVAPYFRLSHFFDSSRQLLFLCKTPYTSMPSSRFSELVKSPDDSDSACAESPGQFKIMKRDPAAAQRQQLQQQQQVNAEKKVLTLEERRLAYEQARARIFNDENSLSDA
ncbi:single-stranded nucleic acid binding R3H [Gongronella butleri]|nr:single-stranded nucleic acid binding R3H [Gongronella butleri]